MQSGMSEGIRLGSTDLSTHIIAVSVGSTGGPWSLSDRVQPMVNPDGQMAGE